jgi:hypothetical protein
MKTIDKITEDYIKKMKFLSNESLRHIIDNNITINSEECSKELNRRLNKISDELKKYENKYYKVLNDNLVQFFHFSFVNTELATYPRIETEKIEFYISNNIENDDFEESSVYCVLAKYGENEIKSIIKDSIEINEEEYNKIVTFYKNIKNNIIKSIKNEFYTN